MPSAGSSISAEIRGCLTVSQLETKKSSQREEPWEGLGVEGAVAQSG